MSGQHPIEVSYKFLKLVEKPHPFLRAAKLCSFKAIGSPILVENIKASGFQAAANAIGAFAVDPDSKELGFRMSYKQPRSKIRDVYEKETNIFLKQPEDLLFKSKRTAEEAGINYVVVPDSRLDSEVRELRIGKEPYQDIYMYPYHPNVCFLQKSNENGRIIPVDLNNSSILNLNIRRRFNPLIASGPMPL